MKNNYRPSAAFIKYNRLAEEWNKKLEKKLKKLVRNLEEWDDYSDEGWAKFIMMYDQRFEIWEQISANNLKANDLLRKEDELHGYIG